MIGYDLDGSGFIKVCVSRWLVEWRRKWMPWTLRYKTIYVEPGWSHRELAMPLTFPLFALIDRVPSPGIVHNFEQREAEPDDDDAARPGPA